MVRPHANQNVISWIAEQPHVDIAISIVSFAEIREGIGSSPNRIRRQQLAEWFESTVMTLFRQQMLPLDEAVLIDWLRLSRKIAQRQITRQAPDLLLASTARIHRLIVVTRNTRDFANTGVVVYNPWMNETHTTDAT